MRFFSFIILSLTVFLAHYYVVGNAVWGDGRYYYVYTRSAIIDHDLDFTNESYVHPFALSPVKTATGKILNKYTIGAPLLWSPWFFLAHLISRSDGYGHIYRLFVGFGCVLMANLGLYLSYLLIKKHTNRQTALLTITCLFLSSNLFFYTAVDPINSHSSSLLLASALIYFWSRWRNSFSIKKIAVLSILCGILGMIRPQDTLLGLPILLDIWKRSAKKRIFLLVFLAGAALSFSPQLLTLIYIYGRIINPYALLGEGFNWLKPQIFNVLFSSNNGLFYYSPVFFLAVFGLIIYFKTSFLARAGLIMFCLQLYLISCWSGWWGGAAFGGRMFLSLTPFFGLGLAWLIQAIKTFVHPKKLYVVFSLLILINFSQMLYLLLST